MKKIIFIISAVFLSFMIFFTVGEICFRVFRGAPNPLEAVAQKYENYLFSPNEVKPSQSSIEGEFDFVAHINKYGYRGRDFKMPKDPGTVRIMALGDSFTYGVGASDEKTIPALLEQALSKQGIPAEVINAGVGHAGTIRHYINLKSFHLKYQPDMVLLLFDLTDLMDDWYVERHAIIGPDGEIEGIHPLFKNGKRDWWLTFAFHSAFCRYIHDKVVRAFEKWRLLGTKKLAEIKKEGLRAKAVIINSDDMPDDVILQYDYLLFMRGEKRKSLIDRQFKRTAEYLLKIRDMLNEKGIPMVIVMYPHGIYVGKDEWSEGRLTWGFEKDKLYTDYYPFELMESFAKKNNIAFINTLNRFLNADRKEKLFFDWDGHMKPAGNMLVSDGITQNIVFQSTLNSVLGKMLKQAFPVSAEKNISY